MKEQKLLFLTVGNINYDCALNFYETLVQLFSTVLSYNYVEKAIEIGIPATNIEIVELTKKEKPDYIFLITHLDQINIKTLDTLSNLGTKVVAWFSDDNQRFESYSKSLAEHIFCSITTYKCAFEKYQKLGLKIIKSQWASNPNYYEKSAREFLYDISFVGGKYGKRQENLDYLTNNTVPVNIFGKGFNNFIAFDEMIKVFNTSKINLNFSDSSHEEFGTQIKGRVFEVTMCGGFLLTEYAEGIEEYFEIGKEIVCFTSLDEAADKIKYYLAHEEERRKIAEAGYNRAQKEHTWLGRLEAIFTEIQTNSSTKKRFDMNILLTTSAAPSQTPFSTMEKRPPIGIGFLISVLKKAGHNVFFIDNYLQPSDFLETEYLQQNNIDYVGIYANTICYRDTLRMLYKLEWLRQINKWKGKIIVGGPHTTVCPDTIPAFVDFVVQGEGEYAILDIVTRKVTDRVVKYPRIDNLDDLPMPAWDYFANLPYTWGGGAFFIKEPVFTMNTSRGCPFRCLAGDTLIHTLKGIFTIKSLVGQIGVKVLSRDPETQMPLYTNASRIFKTQNNAKLVRVYFDNGDSIDCTPEHKFKVFKSKNQYIEESEWDVEAKDLKPKQRIRAILFETQKTGRKNVSTRRNICLSHSRIVMEAVLERKLNKIERIHHRDTNPGNDHPDNLMLTDARIHSLLHPEIAERMRNNNPAKNMTDVWRQKIAVGLTGKKRSLEQRIRYRESKLGAKNPNFNPDLINHEIRPSRIKEIAVNHKVLRVEELPYKEDVYCMEVPKTHWFYANNVLVHNCSYCSVGSIWGKKYTAFSAERIVSDIEYLIKNYGAKGIYFREDNFTLSKSRLTTFCNLMIRKKINIPWACESRVSSIDRQNIELMKRAGVCGFYFGVESGSQRVLDFVKKDITIAQTKEAFRLCHEHGINAAASIIVGVPTETEKELNQTLDLIKEIKPTATWFNVFTGIPNSELYKYTIENNLYRLIDDRGLVYMPKHDKLTKRFYGGRWDSDIPICTPRISVVMSVYNGEKYLKKAMQSILRQTYQDFEFIIVNDCSIDATSKIIESFNDSRIKVINNPENIGLTKSLNKGIKATSGEYIARMDADDVSLPHRFELQIAFLDKNPEYALVGSSFYKINDAGRIIALVNVLTENTEIRSGLKTHNKLGHGSVLMRKSSFIECKGYNEGFKYTQDYDLWLRMSERFKIANIKEPLYCWRATPYCISALKRNEQRYYADLAVSLAKIRSIFVSIIVPTYNRPEMLREALKSILAQTHKNFEIIVVNDAGIDIKDVITELNTNNTITYIQHIENKGLAATRNSGLELAKGKYIAYLDDDDIFYPDHLETLVTFLENNECKVAYTDANGATQVREANGDYKITRRWLYMSRDFSRSSLLQNNLAPVHCFMHEKSCLNEGFRFDEGLRTHEDYEFWMRMARKYDFKHIKKTTVEYRHRTEGFVQLSRTPQFFQSRDDIISRMEKERILWSQQKAPRPVEIILFPSEKPESIADQKRERQGRRRVYKNNKA